MKTSIQTKGTDTVIITIGRKVFRISVLLVECGIEINKQGSDIHDSGIHVCPSYSNQVKLF